MVSGRPTAPSSTRRTRQKVPGHLSFDFESAACAPLAGAAERLRVLDREGRPHLPGDNPHTKPFAFWSGDRGAEGAYPELIFLARRSPAQVITGCQTWVHPVLLLLRLAQPGLELRQYFTELTQSQPRILSPQPLAQYPDILTDSYRRRRGPAPCAWSAATLGANYGIYGQRSSCSRRRRSRPARDYLARRSTRSTLAAGSARKPARFDRSGQRDQNDTRLQQDATCAFEHGQRDPAGYAKTSPDGSDVIATVVT